MQLVLQHCCKTSWRAILSPTNYTCVPTNHASLFWMENVEHSFSTLSAAMLQNKLHDFIFRATVLKTKRIKCILALRHSNRKGNFEICIKKIIIKLALFLLSIHCVIKYNSLKRVSENVCLVFPRRNLPGFERKRSCQERIVYVLPENSETWEDAFH